MAFRVDTIATATSLPLEVPLVVRPLPSGDLAVLDYKACKLLIVDSLGHLRATYGRAGKGPGELTLAFGFTLHGDTIAVFDVGNGRLANFLPDRGFVGVRPLPAGFAHQSFILLDADTVIHMTDGVDSALVVRRSPDGRVLVRYGTPVAPPTTFFDFRTMKQAAREGRVPEELRNSAVPVLGPTGDVWVIQQATGRVERFTSAGRLLGGLTLPQEYIRQRTAAFFHDAKAVEKDGARFAAIYMVAGAAADSAGLWMLLAQPDSASAQLVRADTTYIIRGTYNLPGAAGARFLTKDDKTGAFYLINPGEAVILRVTPLHKSAA